MKMACEGEECFVFTTVGGNGADGRAATGGEEAEIAAAGAACADGKGFDAGFAGPLPEECLEGLHCL